MHNKWNATDYKEHGSFVSDLAEDLVDLLQVKTGEKILDLGCGDGTLALKIQALQADIIGIDASQSMIDKAIKKGIQAEVMDILALDFSNEFDAIFSNATLHWVKEAKKALTNIANALKKEGRFVADFGAFGNIQIFVDAIQKIFHENPQYGTYHSPWYFPTKEDYAQLLKESGFSIVSIEVYNRPTEIKSVSSWINTFANIFISHLSKEDKLSFTDKVTDLLQADKSKVFLADYVRLRLHAIKN